MFAKHKHLLVLFVLVLVLSTIGASPAKAAQDVTLAGREFFPGKGLVFYFNVDDSFDVDGAAKYVIIDGVQYELTCRLRDDGLLACLADAPRSVIGKEADVHFGPYEFETVIPEAHIPPAPSQYCYPVFDYEGSYYQVGTHCQASPGSDGEVIMFEGDLYQFIDAGQKGPGYYILLT